MNEWKEAREGLNNLLKTMPPTNFMAKAVSTALKALDIAEKMTHSAQFRRVELLQADLAQKEKRIEELTQKIRDLEEHMKLVCRHDGEEKNGICLECGDNV